MLRRAFKAGRKITCRAGRALTNAKGSFGEPALNPRLYADHRRVGGEKARVAPKETQTREQAAEEHADGNARRRAPHAGQSVTSTPRQNATRFLIASAAGLGAG